MDSEDAVVACSLAEGELVQRAAMWRSLAPEIVSLERDAGRLRARYRSDVASTLSDLVEAERSCCPWAAWTLREQANVVTVEVTGQESGIRALGEVLRPGAS